MNILDLCDEILLIILQKLNNKPGDMNTYGRIFPFVEYRIHTYVYERT